MKLVSIKCPECGASLNGDKKRSVMFCEYCGTKIMLDDIKYYREDAKTARRKLEMDAETERHKITENQLTEREWIGYKKQEISAKKKIEHDRAGGIIFLSYALLLIVAILMVCK